MLEEFKYKTAVHFLVRQMQADNLIEERDMFAMIALATSKINLSIAKSSLKRGVAKTKFDACCIVFSTIISSYVNVGISDNIDYGEKTKKWRIALELANVECGFFDE